MASERPLLAVTMGDPAGIGAEILVKALSRPALYDTVKPFVIGSVDCLRLAAEQVGAAVNLQAVTSRPGMLSRIQGEPGLIEVLEPVPFDISSLSMGKVSADCGRAAVGYFESAVNLCLNQEIQGVVTCPINKEAVHEAGFHGDIGHQEILARMTGSQLTATLLMTRGLKVAHLSTHKSLAEAVAYVRTPVLVDKLQLTCRSLESWGIRQPRVAVAALNPHGGEGGLLGREEIDEITPAVQQCQQMGLNVSGPFPADSVFYRAINGEFDAVLALYHDQGHIAIKVHNFEESITATMGIPFVRTSVDHGTAFDIAGQNRAEADSLERALTAASDMLNKNLE